MASHEYVSIRKALRVVSHFDSEILEVCPFSFLKNNPGREE